MLLAFTLQSMSQKISLPDGYTTKNSSIYAPVMYEHKRSFDTKYDAIHTHRDMLYYLGIDTTNSVVDYSLDTPIFSNFILRGYKNILIVTYVTKNDDGGYDSYFLESRNVEFDLFESDGLLFTNQKRD